MASVAVVVVVVAVAMAVGIAVVVVAEAALEKGVSRPSARPDRATSPTLERGSRVCRGR
jgi:hypothetical protein